MVDFHGMQRRLNILYVGPMVMFISCKQIASRCHVFTHLSSLDNLARPDPECLASQLDQWIILVIGDRW